jgi:hypothetical protein
MDAGQDVAIEVRVDHTVTEPNCPADAMGGGQCPVNFCGQLASVASLPMNQVASSSADAVCNSGRVCVIGPAVATGDAFQLVCLAPTAGALPFGSTCSTTPADGKRCADDSLCVASADAPGSLFCSTLCRNDADCPSDASGQARCIEHQTGMLPNGSYARVGLCTPMSKISGTPCVRERDCAASEGCLAYGPRTRLRICRASAGQKSLGAACGAAAECRSGECYDRTWLVANGANRAACSGACTVNSDCGPDQHCARLVTGNNGTPSDPLDDVVSGYCHTMFPPTIAEDCNTDAACVARQDGSDTCDVAHGLCYRQAAVPGSACASDSGCMLDGTCSTGPRFIGGYCQSFGCSPTAGSGVDACAGAQSSCAQRGGPDEPIAGCYERCGGAAQTACTRPTDGYVCAPPTTGVPPSICLVGNGT